MFKDIFSKIHVYVPLNPSGVLASKDVWPIIIGTALKFPFLSSSWLLPVTTAPTLFGSITGPKGKPPVALCKRAYKHSNFFNLTTNWWNTCIHTLLYWEATAACSCSADTDFRPCTIAETLDVDTFKFDATDLAKFSGFLLRAQEFNELPDNIMAFVYNPRKQVE